jgi:hypothetical protein
MSWFAQISEQDWFKNTVDVVRAVSTVAESRKHQDAAAVQNSVLGLTPLETNINAQPIDPGAWGQVRAVAGGINPLYVAGAAAVVVALIALRS